MERLSSDQRGGSTYVQTLVLLAFVGLGGISAFKVLGESIAEKARCAGDALAGSNTGGRCGGGGTALTAEPPGPAPEAPRGESQGQGAGDTTDTTDTTEPVVAAARPAPPLTAEMSLPSLDDIRQAIGDGARDVGESIGDRIRGQGVAIDAGLDRIGRAIDLGLDTIGDLQGGVVKGLGDLTGIDGISDAGRAIERAPDVIGDTINRAYDETGDAAEDVRDAQADEVEDNADDIGDAADPDEETGEEDKDQDGEDGDPDDQGEDDQDDEPEPELDRNGHWERANGPKPDLETISAAENRGHILYGGPDDDGEITGGHKHGSGIPDKTTFPESWDDDDKIIRTVEDVARNPDEPPEYDENKGRWVVRGTRDNVDIEVVVAPDGEIITAYPTGGEGVHRNDENGDPQPLD
jgi:Bacterial EndoU nuclease